MFYSINSINDKGLEEHWGTYNGEKATLNAYTEILAKAKKPITLTVLDANFQDCSEYFADSYAELDTKELRERLCPAPNFEDRSLGGLRCDGSVK